MKLNEIPVSTVVELRFYYTGIRYKIHVGLFYKYLEAVYVSALKTAGKTVSASKLHSVNLIYHNEEGMYTFHNVSLRSLSLNGQKLYAINSGQDAQVIKNTKANRLYLGTQIWAKIILGEKKEYVQCILKDISVRGMGVISNRKLDENARIEVSCTLNDQNELLAGNIVRASGIKDGEGYLYNCEFDEPKEEIGKYVAYKILLREEAIRKAREKHT